MFEMNDERKIFTFFYWLKKCSWRKPFHPSNTIEMSSS